MGTCKIDHSDPDNIPEFLCRVCNPRPRASEPEALSVSVSVDATRYDRKKKRRLRAEVRKLADELDKLRVARVGKALIEKAEAKWQHAYNELALMDGDD